MVVDRHSKRVDKEPVSVSVIIHNRRKIYQEEQTEKRK